MTTFDALLSLLDQARAEAARLGRSGHTIVAHLDKAMTEAHALAALDGEVDEGKRPEELSSANDG